MRVVGNVLETTRTVLFPTNLEQGVEKKNNTSPLKAHQYIDVTHWRHLGVQMKCGTYPLLLGGHKGLESRGHPKAELLDKWWLRLAVDLNFDSSLERRLFWKKKAGG